MEIDGWKNTETAILFKGMTFKTEGFYYCIGLAHAYKKLVKTDPAGALAEQLKENVSAGLGDVQDGLYKDLLIHSIEQADFYTIAKELLK